MDQNGRSEPHSNDQTVKNDNVGNQFQQEEEPPNWKQDIGSIFLLIFFYVLQVSAKYYAFLTVGIQLPSQVLLTC